ncbi:MAG: arginine--tRNA ligase [bacterium]|nr:arginine--tRNA ligase [bacterium]
MTIKQELSNLIKEAILKLPLKEQDVPEIIIEKPRHKTHGDFATNAAFLLAKKLRASPYQISNKIVELLPTDSFVLEKVEIAGGGFINLFLTPSRFHQVLPQIEAEDTLFGTSKTKEGRVLVEFVSANPTGPLHIGHGRGAVYGDCLANIMTAVGYQVEREYYINDVGNQMQSLGRSLLIRYKQLQGDNVPLPENAYQGAYLIQLAKTLPAGAEDKGLDFFVQLAKEEILKEIRDDLARLGVKFNRWFSEESLYASGRVDETIRLLKQKSYAYEKDDAWWLASSGFGDDKDRVLVRETNVPTYLAGDIAYHRDKYDRGCDLLIDIWGADHHGYVDRMKAACAALDHNPDSLVILLYQLVNLLRDGKQVNMSTREGEFVTLKEVVDEVGPDAARFFFLMRDHNSHLDFDLELAKRHSTDNPVYYVQYAHARICSILREAAARKIEPLPAKKCQLNLLTVDNELEILTELAALPDDIINCANTFQVHHLTLYLQDLAALFHHYYNHNRIISQDRPLSLARLAMVNSIRIVIRNVLHLLGISAPEKM